MQSNLLNSIGLGSLDISYILIGMLVLIIILFVLIIVQIVKGNKLKKRYEIFMNGKEAKSLESEIIGLFEDNRFLRTSAEENRKDIRKLYRNLELTFQKAGLIKYDAFREMGGQLSFSLALLNDRNDGFIMNSVHSTDGCYTYTKEIHNGECMISLGEEEKKALEKAMQSNQKKQGQRTD